MDIAWYLFGFEGRINRARFWQALLIMIFLMMVLALAIITIGKFFGSSGSFSFGLDDIFAAFDPQSYRSLSTTGYVRTIGKAIGTPLFLWVYLATSIKRLHDRNKSAWWMLLYFFFPGLFDQFADRLGDSYPVIFVALVSTGCC